MGPKADGLRAMRERNFDAGEERRKIDRERERLKKAMDDASARIAAKPKRKPKPFIPIDDTMLVPTGSFPKPAKRKPKRHK